MVNFVHKFKPDLTSNLVTYKLVRFWCWQGMKWSYVELSKLYFYKFLRVEWNEAGIFSQ